MRLPATALACLLGGCAAFAPPATKPVPAPPPVPTVTDLAPYFATLDQLAGSDPARQAALLGELQARLASSPGARTALRHALAVGAAGREGSDPVEARRLLAELLAAPGALEPAEQQMAAALLREFDARVTLYAQLGRQREELEARMAAETEAHARALQAATAEAARLRRELKQAETKLQAITEMERELLEQAEPAPPSPPR
jgi:chromosome segregation ATPase